MKALDERANKIAEGLAAAERGKSDFEQAEKRVAAILAEGRQQVAEMVANADKRAAEIMEAAKQQASDEAAKILAQARADVAQEANRAREALRNQVGILAVKGAEQILRREIDANAHSDLLGALKQEL
ncbi:MAG: F0F1 ATP synthase subunit B [Neisseriaceae bacterium]|nr:F0F1 ATP synthase subunit B [Neisseriaceae bacterium]